MDQHFIGGRLSGLALMYCMWQLLVWVGFGILNDRHGAVALLTGVVEKQIYWHGELPLFTKRILSKYAFRLREEIFPNSILGRYCRIAF